MTCLPWLDTLTTGLPQPHEIDWKKCIEMCTDGVANMTRHLSGIVAKVKKVGHPDILSTHYNIHQEQLAAKKMFPELHEVLSYITEIMKEIRHKTLNSRLFETFCEKMGVPSILIVFVMQKGDGCRGAKYRP
ncbi:uncharacterized protein TNCV_2793031 [Trichonephila clavipes]|nr:uncharacterized protein TNCV_2793031 [Trichonephila clavipes]